MANTRPPTTEQILAAVKAKAETINANPFGAMTLEWQNGVLVWSKVELKEKHT